MTPSSRQACSSLILLLALAFVLPLASVHAAPEPVVFIDKIEVELIQPEKFGRDRGDVSYPKKWALVEWSYTVTPEKGTYLDEVQFKVSLEGLDPESAAATSQKGEAVMLQGEVTYIMIPAGKAYGVLYLPPELVNRYQVAQNANRYNVHVEALVGGQAVDAKDRRKENDPDWYKPYKGLANALRLKNDTPFIVNDTMRYPAIKPK